VADGRRQVVLDPVPRVTWAEHRVPAGGDGGAEGRLHGGDGVDVADVAVLQSECAARLKRASSGFSKAFCRAAAIHPDLPAMGRTIAPGTVCSADDVLDTCADPGVRRLVAGRPPPVGW
jgi:hypothetical protein